jgi:hypothetical protein
MFSKTPKCRLLQFPKIEDDRGNLSFLEAGKQLPFEMARAYWIYDVPGGEQHGGHAQGFAHFDAMFPIRPGDTGVVHFGSLNHKGFSIEQELLVSYFEARGFGSITSCHQANQA